MNIKDKLVQYSDLKDERKDIARRIAELETKEKIIIDSVKRFK